MVYYEIVCNLFLEFLYSPFVACPLILVTQCFLFSFFISFGGFDQLPLSKSEIMETIEKKTHKVPIF